MTKTLLKFFVTALGVVCLIAGFVLGVMVKERTSNQYNALFNIGPAGEIGFWIYATHGNCPGLRSMDKAPLVLITPASYSGHGRLDVKALKTCMELQVENRSNSRTLSCKAGFLTVDDHAGKKERRGSFSITLADGRVRTGDIVAGFCPAD